MAKIDDGSGFAMLARHALVVTYKLKPPKELRDKFFEGWEEKYGTVPPR